MGAFGVSLEVKGLRDLHREMSVSEFRVLGLGLFWVSLGVLINTCLLT